MVEKATFKPDFSHIYFVYLNKKQSSKTAINYHTNKTNNLNTNIDAINKITLEVLHANSLYSFAQAIEKHENKMSIVLKRQQLKKPCFLILTVK
jgi:outer membrane protein assembly factor BamE (lipoprotein component of BamABCDE complex)